MTLASKCPVRPIQGRNPGRSFLLISVLVTLVLLTSATLTGCAGETTPLDGGESSEAASPTADSEAARRSVMEADRAFARAFAERGVEVWADFFAPDGVQIPGGLPAARGRDEVRALAERLFGGSGFEALTWEPVQAEVAASGDLAYTLGNYVAEGTDAKGEPMRQEGNYVTIWRRARDGTWQVVVDIGNAGPPLQPPAD